MTHQELRAVSGRWFSQVRKAFLYYEIRDLPSGTAQQLQFLNWRVWTLRYGISLNYIIGKLLERYGKARELRRASTNLGIPTNVITSSSFQQYLEQQIIRDYPNGESLDAQRSEMLRRILRPGVLAAPEAEESLQHYVMRYQTKSLQKRKESLKVRRRTQRPWRNNPWK